jgi:HD superfamily phosphodiesterase
MNKQGQLLRILETDWAKSTPLLEKFRQTAYFQELLTAWNQLDAGILYKSWLHGPGHIERTMLLGALIAWQEQLSPRDTKLLLTACSYHDIGRINDRREDAHGERAAGMLAGERLYLHENRIQEEDRAILYAMVAAHSLSDKTKTETAKKYNLQEDQLPRYMELAACLKDADNLDRVRLGDLDSSRLRHRSSRNLVIFADDLYREYK